MRDRKRLPTTFGLSRYELDRLKQVSSDFGEAEQIADPDQLRTEFLQDMSAQVLSEEPSALKYLPAALRLMIDLPDSSQKSVGEVVLNEKIHIHMVRKVKDYAKKLSVSTTSAAEKDAATAIYYAAIANALVFKDARITRYSYKTLKDKFSSLCEKPWLPPEFIEIFKKACSFCQNEMAKKPPLYREK